jgi:glycolate oxidase FAD binding subunit
VTTIHPTTVGDLADALRTASRTGRRILVVGGRLHMDRGNPSEVDAELWTTQLDRVVAYEPAEMLAVVEGGLRCGAFAELLAEHDQEWPVDAPPNATVGGVIAAGISSTRRLRVGHVRDTVAEMHVVTGDGRFIKSGARTMKNVSGFDVHRLMTGSLGTLGVIAQVALKVRPLSEASVTLVADTGGLPLALDVLEALPGASEILAGPEAVSVRLEGWRHEVNALEAAARELGPFVPGATPERPAGAALLEAAVAPSRLAELVEDIDAWQALAGVGLAWIGVDGPEPLAAIRARAAELGGIAPAVRGPGGLGDTSVPGLEIHRRLKAAFDPAGVMAPGRFWGST